MSTQVTPEPAPPSTPMDAWLAERNTGIGGSEAFELLNEPQYGKGCATALAFRKLGTEPDYPQELDADDQALLRRGNILEPLVAQMYEQETGRKVRRPNLNEHGLPKLQRSKSDPWAVVHTDRLILAGAGGVEETGDLEIKTRGEGPFLRVLRTGPFPGDMLQPQWSTFVTGHSWAALATLGLFGSLPLRHFDVRRDEQLIDLFKREGNKFADQVWGHNQVPEPVIAADDPRCKVCEFRMTCRGEQIDRAAVQAMKEIKANKKPLIQIADPELAHVLNDADILKAEIKTLEGTLEHAQAKAKEALTAAGVTPGTGGYVVQYGKVYLMESQANYLDSQRIKADHPDWYEQYFVSKKTGDTFLRGYPAKQTI